jgi:hypothetical protein
MNPISFTKCGDTTYFHYRYSDLRRFVRDGKRDGNVGLILTKRNSKISTYRGFGTIENPFRYIATVSLMRNDVFDGPRPTDDEILSPPKEEFADFRFVILDLNTL